MEQWLHHLGDDLGGVGQVRVAISTAVEVPPQLFVKYAAHCGWLVRDGNNLIGCFMNICTCSHFSDGVLSQGESCGIYNVRDRFPWNAEVLYAASSLPL